MKVILQKYLYIICLTLYTHLLFSQESPLYISYSRQNNVTYTGNYALNFQKKWDKYRIETFSRHDHLLNKERESPFVQANFHTNIWQYYQIKPKWAVVSWLEGDQFIINKTQRYSMYAGFEYRIDKKFIIKPLLGYSFDQLTGIWNQGFSPALQVYHTHSWADGLTVENKLYSRLKFINPRHQRNINLSSMWSKDFEGNGNINIGLVIGSNETDNFKAKSIEKIQSDSLSPVLSIHYEPIKNLIIETNNQYLYAMRRFNYKADSTEFNNLRFEQSEVLLQQRAIYQIKRLKIDLTYIYQFGQRKYNVQNNIGLSIIEYEKLKQREQQKDFSRNMQLFELNINYQLNPKHSISIMGNNRYLQYDTPSETNYDDHDELNYGLSTEIESNWSSNFYTRYKTEFNYRQYAFLFKQKSQDNYTQYVLRTEFAYRWQFHPQWRLSGEQYIYVTYNVKDFMDINFTDRSTRNLETRFNIQYIPKEKRQHLLSFYHKETHLSYLNWQTFTEATLDTTYTLILEQKNSFCLRQDIKKGKIWIDIGYKHFYLYRYQNTAMYNLQNIVKPINLHILNYQTGLITGIRWFNDKRTSYDCTFWWQYQQQYYKYFLISQFSTFQSNYKEIDLQKTNRYFRPFIDFKLNFFF